jgi:hypothetical protein
MDILDTFFKKYAYRFDKGYPDMDNKEDILLLESLLSEILGSDFKIKEEVLEEEEEEQQTYSYEDLIKLIQSKKDTGQLDDNFIQKLYHTLEGKGQKLGTYLQQEFSTRGLSASTNELFGTISQYPGLEKQLVNVLKDSEKQITLNALTKGSDIVTIATATTGLPAEFITALLKAGKSTEKGKGVGEGEALLALLGRGGKKMDVGDVQIEGKEIEVKGGQGRLIGRSTGAQDLYAALTQLGVEPRMKGKGKEALHTYIPHILQTQPELKEQVRKLLKNKFETPFNTDLTNPAEVQNALLEWYVDYFKAHEGKTADYIIVIIGTAYKFLNLKKGEFKQAVLSKQIKIKNFSASDTSPQIIGFD